MKRLITLLFVFVCLAAHSQFINQLTLLHTFTQSQVDSLLGPSGISAIVTPTHGVKLYKVKYNTVSWDSTPYVASGLLCLPVGNTCKTGLLSYQHGTTTKKTDVPSRLQGSEWYIGLAAAGLGFVTVLPDYLGLGSGTGLHPYQHAHSEATAVIDMIRTAKEIVDTLGAPLNKQLFLFGYSQGGHATMAAHQLLQEQFDSTLHVTASAPMSGAYDMGGTMVDLMLSDSTYPEPYYLPYLMFGYNEVYHLFTNDSDVMVHPYDSLLRPLFDGQHSGGQVNDVMPAVPKLILQPYQIDSFVNAPDSNFLRVRLKENDTYNWVPNSPMRIYFCRGDHSVPFQNSIVAYQHFKQNGSQFVDTVDVSGTLDHYPCANFAIANATLWFLNNMAYQPASSAGTTVTNDTTVANPSGSASVNSNHGNPPLTYLWSTGDTSQTIINLPAGVYYVTVTDQSDCSFTDSATVQFISGLQNQMLGHINVYPNPAQGVVNIQNQNSNDNIAQTEVYDMNGQLVTTYTVKRGNLTQLYFDKAAPGVYTLRIIGESGKEMRTRLTIIN